MECRLRGIAGRLETKSRFSCNSDPGAALHQLGNGAHSHLRHHASAVHFHRLFADRQFRGDLFIESAGNYVLPIPAALVR